MLIFSHRDPTDNLLTNHIMTTFTINFTNNSGSAGDFCVFQQNPNTPNSDVLTLAWRTQSVAPHAQIPLSWNVEFYFFWAKTGKLAPCTIFNAGEAIPTSPFENNEITLTKQDGNYKFIKQRKYNQVGTFCIISENTTAVNQASVGIGMSGAGTFAVQAQPNMIFLFSPHPEYWVTFGNFKQGQVLHPSEIAGGVKVDFPHGIFSMNVVLNADNTWTVTQGLD
jgi:hypothetical protein